MVRCAGTTRKAAWKQEYLRTRTTERTTERTQALPRTVSPGRLLVPVLLFFFLLIGGRPVYGVETIYQSYNALQPYSTSSYEMVYNANKTVTGYTCAYTTSQEMNSIDGGDMKFRSLIYTGIPNPQSMTVSDDGKTAWVMSSAKSGSDNSRRGRIYKVDLSRFWGKKASGSKDSDAVTAGPEIVTGHGQTLSYNPKTHELWYVRETKVTNTTLVQVDPDTMEVVKEIHFRFSGNIVFPPTFTFDGDGNCWTYTRSTGSSWVSRGTIRFYKGKIENDSVTFEMIQQGVRYPPGNLCQGFGYDPVNDLLYVGANGAVMTVPAKKLSQNAITADDVHTIRFDGTREFEGIAFDETGCAYFLTNKPSEIMRDTVSYQKALKLRTQFDEAKETYQADQEDMEAQKETETQEILTEKIGEALEEGL